MKRPFDRVIPFILKHLYRYNLRHKISSFYYPFIYYLISKYNVTLTDISMPELDLRQKYYYYSHKFLHWFSLNWFFDPYIWEKDADIRIDEEWLTTCRSEDGEECGAPALAWIPIPMEEDSSDSDESDSDSVCPANGNLDKIGNYVPRPLIRYSWQRVSVFEYSQKHGCYQVVPTSLAHGPYYVERCYLVFRSEDGDFAANRIYQATVERYKHEVGFRFYSYFMFSETWLGFVEDEMMYEDLIIFPTGRTFLNYKKSGPFCTHDWPNPFQPSYIETKVLPLAKYYGKIKNFKRYDKIKGTALAKRFYSRYKFKENFVKLIQKNLSETSSLSDWKYSSEDCENYGIVSKKKPHLHKPTTFKYKWRHIKVKGNFGDSKYKHIEGHYEKVLRLKHMKNFYAIPVFNMRKYVTTQMKINQFKKYYPYLYKRKRMQNKWKQYLRNEKEYDEKIKQLQNVKNMQPKKKTFKNRPIVKLGKTTLRDIMEMASNHDVCVWELWRLNKFYQRKCPLCYQTVDTRYHLCPNKFWVTKEEWNVPSFEIDREDPTYLPLINEFSIFFFNCLNRTKKFEEKSAKSEYLLRAVQGYDMRPRYDELKRGSLFKRMIKDFSGIPVRKHHPTPKIQSLPEKSRIELEEEEEELFLFSQPIAQLSLESIEGKEIEFERLPLIIFNWGLILKMAKCNEENKLEQNNKKDKSLKEVTKPDDTSNMLMKSDSSLFSPFEETYNEDSVIPGVPASEIKAWKARMKYIRTMRHVGIQCPSETDTQKRTLESSVNYEFQLASRNIKKKKKLPKRQSYKSRNSKRHNKTKNYGSNSLFAKYLAYKENKINRMNRKNIGIAEDEKPKQVVLQPNVQNSSTVRLSHNDGRKQHSNSMITQLDGSESNKIIMKSNVAVSSKHRSVGDTESDIFKLSSKKQLFTSFRRSSHNDERKQHPISMITQLDGSKSKKIIFKPNVAVSSKLQSVGDIESDIFKLSSKTQLFTPFWRSSNNDERKQRPNSMITQLDGSKSKKIIINPNVAVSSKLQSVYDIESDIFKLSSKTQLFTPFRRSSHNDERKQHPISMITQLDGSKSKKIINKPNVAVSSKLQSVCDIESDIFKLSSKKQLFTPFRRSSHNDERKQHPISMITQLDGSKSKKIIFKPNVAVSSKLQSVCDIESDIFKLSSKKQLFTPFRRSSHNDERKQHPISMITQLDGSKSKKIIFKPNVAVSSKLQSVGDIESDIFKLSSKTQLFTPFRRSSHNDERKQRPNSMITQLDGSKSKQIIIKPNVAVSSKLQSVYDIESDIFKLSSKKQLFTPFCKSSKIQSVEGRNRNILGILSENDLALSPSKLVNNTTKNDMFEPGNVNISVERYIKGEDSFLNALTKEYKSKDLKFTSSCEQGSEPDEFIKSLPSTVDESSFLSVMTTHSRSEETMEFPARKYKYKCASRSKKNKKFLEKIRSGEKRYQTTITNIEHRTYKEKNKRRNKVKSRKKYRTVFQIKRDNQINSFINSKNDKWSFQNFPVLKDSKYGKPYRNVIKQSVFIKDLLPVSYPVVKEEFLRSSEESVTETAIEIEDSSPEDVSASTSLEYLEKISGDRQSKCDNDYMGITLPIKAGKKPLKDDKFALKIEKCRCIKWPKMATEDANLYSEEHILQKGLKMINKDTIDDFPKVEGVFRSRSPFILAALGREKFAAKYFALKEMGRLSGIYLFNKCLTEKAVYPCLDSIDSHPGTYVLKSLPKRNPVFEWDSGTEIIKPYSNYNMMKKFLRNRFFYSRSPIFYTLWCNHREACLHILNMRLFLCREMVNSCSLKIFLENLRINMEQVIKQVYLIKNQTLINLKAIFDKRRKGDLMFNVTKTEFFQKLKWFRICRLFSLMFTIGIRGLFSNSLNQLRRAMQQICSKTARAPSVYLDWGENLSSQRCTPKVKYSFFNLKLGFGPYGIAYSDDVSHYEEEILNAIWQSLECLQIHPNLETELNTKYLWNPLLMRDGRGMGLIEKPVIRNIRLIKKYIKTNTRVLKSYLDKYLSFDWVKRFDPLFVAHLFLLRYKKRKTIFTMISYLYRLQRRAETIPKIIRIGMFRIYTQDTKGYVLLRLKMIIAYIINLFNKGDWMYEMNLGSYSYKILFNLTLKKLDTKGPFESLIGSIAKLFWVDQIVDNLRNLKYIEMKKKRWFFLKYHPYIDPDDGKSMMTLLCLPNWIYLKLEKLMKLCILRLNQIKELQPWECKNFCDGLLDLKTQIDMLRKYNSLSQLGTAAALVLVIDGALEKAFNELEKHEIRNDFFNLDPERTVIYSYPEPGSNLKMKDIIMLLNDVRKDFEPFRKFWTAAYKWRTSFESWIMEHGARTLDLNEVQNTFVQLQGKIEQCIEIFNKCPDHLQAALTIHLEMGEFGQVLEALKAIQHPRTTLKHVYFIKNISNVIYYDYFTDWLYDSYDYILLTSNYWNAIGEILTSHSEILEKFEAIKLKWAKIPMNFKLYKKTEFYVTEIDEKYMLLINEDLVEIQLLRCSKFCIGKTSVLLRRWDRKFTVVLQAIQKWFECQEKWLYLKRVVDFIAIDRDAGLVLHNFKAAELMWHEKYVNPARSTKFLLKIMSPPGILLHINKALDLFDLAISQMNKYFDIKRLSSPRFFFISNNEFIDMIRICTTPYLMLPFLKRIFNYINKLVFDFEMGATHFVSDDFEVVKFTPPINKWPEKIFPDLLYFPIDDPYYPEESYPMVDGTKHSGVEIWVTAIDRHVKFTMRYNIICCLKSYTKSTDLFHWIMQWPGQAAQVALLIYFAGSVEYGINRYCLEAREKHYNTVLHELRQILITQNISRLKRKVIFNICVACSHGSGIFSQLINNEVFDTKDFIWSSQLRYYWVHHELIIKCYNTVYEYGYEYLGTCQRLASTPLTERCFLSITQALRYVLGAMLVGPPGSGKSETIRDLAKASAMLLFAFSCSKLIDYRTLTSILKGTASTGSWTVLEDFNRISPGIVAVVAQLFDEICVALRKKAIKMKLAGVELPLVWTCNLYLTVAPHYGTDWRLPDNLSALLRPVSLIKPDKLIILNTLLCCYGFNAHYELAQKVKSFVKICMDFKVFTEYYDLGLRTIKQVISDAADLKFRYKKKSENVILIRAFRKVMLPRLIGCHIDYFLSALKTVFPQCKLKTLRNSKEDMFKACMIWISRRSLNVVPKRVIVARAMQIYHNMYTRIGVIVYGNAGSGKTTMIKMLKKTMCYMKDAETPFGGTFSRVVEYHIHPKAVTLHHLFGGYSESKKKWSDGLIPHFLRKGSKARDRILRWYIFDGPIDSSWIESLNSAFDGSRSLCLPSEIIKFTHYMNMIFEVDSLNTCCPSMISKMGLVYIPNNLIDDKDLLSSWIRSLPEVMRPYSKRFRVLFDRYAANSIVYITNMDLKHIIPIRKFHMLKSFFKVLDCFMDPLRDTPSLTVEREKLITKLLSGWFVYAAVWGIGGSLDNKGRIMFSKFVKRKMKKHNCYPEAPFCSLYEAWFDQGGFFDPQIISPSAKRAYRFSFVDFRLPTVLRYWEPAWVPWYGNFVKPAQNETSKRYSSLVEEVSTEGRCHGDIIRGLVEHNVHVLCVGPPVTGKSSTILNSVYTQLSKDVSYDTLVFTGASTVDKVQEIFESKLQMYERHLLGPTVGRISQIMVLEDLNIPMPECSENHPIMDLFSQFIEHNWWYNPKSIGVKNKFKNIMLIGSVQLRSFARKIPEKLLWRFNVIAFNEMNHSAQVAFFESLLKPWVQGWRGLSYMLQSIVCATLEVHRYIKAKFLPTPSNIHYMYTLRDVYKVFQGLMVFNQAFIGNRRKLSRLWAHEVARVYQDRMLFKSHQLHCGKIINKVISNNFGVRTMKGVFPLDKTVVYGQIPGTKPGEKFLDFRRIRSLKEYHRHLRKILKEYCNNPVGKNLVLYDEALIHMFRIIRAITQEPGHALILGVVGSGRQTLSRISAYMAGLNLCELGRRNEYTSKDWHRDLKVACVCAGAYHKLTAFLLSEELILNDSWLEDICFLMSTGEVPNIFNNSELRLIMRLNRKIVEELNLPFIKPVIYSHYKFEVLKNLRIIITMCPTGMHFRSRIRKFPAIVERSTIDFISGFKSLETLKSIAHSFFKCGPILLRQFPDLLVRVERAGASIHRSAISFAEVCDKNHSSKIIQIPPSIYLAYLSTFIELVKTRLKGIQEEIYRFEKGLRRLKSPANYIEYSLQELRFKSKYVHFLLKVYSKQKSLFSRNKHVCLRILKYVKLAENIMMEIVVKGMALRIDITDGLHEQRIAYRKACLPLKKMKSRAMLQIVKPRKPPPQLVFLAKAIAHFMSIKPVKTRGPRPGQMVNDFYLPVQLYMRAFPLEFLRHMRRYKIENLPLPAARQISNTLSNTSFDFKAMSKIHKGAARVAHWLLALALLRLQLAKMEPKRNKFRAMRRKLRSMFNDRKDILRSLCKLYNDLYEIKKRQIEIYKRLEAPLFSMPKQIRRMGLAMRIGLRLKTTLITWKINLHILRRKKLVAYGDMLMAAASLHYAGTFPDKYRPLVLNAWAKILEEPENRIPHSSKFKNIVKLLTTNEEKQNWWNHGLSRSSYFTECATITCKTRHVPVMIDPQFIAYEWLCNQYPIKLRTIKMGEPGFVETLKHCIRNGFVLIIESETGYISPALDPLFYKWIFVSNEVKWVPLRSEKVRVHETFRLFILTPRYDPIFSSELYTKVTVINFSYGIRSLRNSLLVSINEILLPGLEQELKTTRETLNKEVALRKELKESTVTGLNQLGTLIAYRYRCFKLFKEARAKDVVCQKKIWNAKLALDLLTIMRTKYHEVTKYPAQLFFCFSGFEVINAAYLFAFDWYKQNFEEIITNLPKGVTDTTKICEIVDKKFFTLMYDKFSRFVFEKDMLQFRFWLTVRLLKYKNQITNQNLMFFIHGNKGKAKDVSVSPRSWIPQKIWDNVLSMEELDDFSKFVDNFKQNPLKFVCIFNTFNPYRELLPHPWQAEMKPFHRLIIVKCFRPEMLKASMEEFVAERLGKITEEQSNIQSKIYKMYMDTDKTVPLLFLLSPGSDITAELISFSREHLEGNKLVTLTHLSGGSFDKIVEAMNVGNWIFIKNVHHMNINIFTSVAESVITTKPEFKNDSFRFWISSEEVPEFPRFIARMASKTCVYSFSGMKIFSRVNCSKYEKAQVFLPILASGTNFTTLLISQTCSFKLRNIFRRKLDKFQSHMIRAYKSLLDDHESLLNTKENLNAQHIRWLVFSLCFFHGLILERNRFGTLAMNVPYKFEDLDFDMCVNQLIWFTKEYGDELPLQLMAYFFGELNYGGRIIDRWDMNTVKTFMEECMQPTVLNSYYSFDMESYFHQLPEDAETTDYLKYMKYLPTDISSRILGLNDTYDQIIKIKEGEECLNQLKLLQPELMKQESLDYTSAKKLGKSIIAFLPRLEPLLIEFIEKNRLEWKNALTIHLREETIRYYLLLEEIRYSIKKMINEFNGHSIVTKDSESIAERIVHHSVPWSWQHKSCPTAKALASWLSDLKDGVRFIRSWMIKSVKKKSGPQPVKISALLMPKAYLSAVMQRYSRKYRIPMCDLRFKSKVIPPSQKYYKYGCIISKLYLRGAAWNDELNVLVDSNRIYNVMPPITLTPGIIRSENADEDDLEKLYSYFTCPIYKSVIKEVLPQNERAYQTNYILSVKLPSLKTGKTMVKRSVALFSSIDE